MSPVEDAGTAPPSPPGIEPPAETGVTPPTEHEIPQRMTLAADFPPATRERWLELVGTVLKRSGSTRTPQEYAAASSRAAATGVTVEPLCLPAETARLRDGAGVPGRSPFVRGADTGPAPGEGWDVRARHDDPDAQAARDAIATDLAGGATSLWIVLGDRGLAVNDLATVLDGVYLDLAPIALDAGAESQAAAEALLSVARSTDVDPADLRGTLGADPFGLTLRTGSPLDLAPAVELALRSVAEHPRLSAITVDTTPVHEAGGTATEEIGTALAAGVASLRALTDAGIALDDAARQLEFRFVANWSAVAGVSEGARGMRQHAVTSTVMMSRRDPWVNMVRTTLACFGAGVGGARAVTVLPFDHALGLPDDFARRIARNTQSLLVAEGHLARVLDPAGGSAHVEALTDRIARAAWDWFTEIERDGGLAAAIESGLVAQRLETPRMSRQCARP